MRTTQFGLDKTLPVLGQGTWNMGDHPRRRAQEIAALRAGIEQGMTLIDTAEMYGDGASELLVGEAIVGLRDQVFIVSKVLPHHATRRGTVDACERSLKRLATDCIDLYLLHWRGNVPLQDTVAGLETLRQSGKIRHWGVSNFDLDDMSELAQLTGGAMATTDQVLYNLSRRGIEHDLLPWCQQHAKPVMAYSPIEQGRLLAHPAVVAIARQRHATVSQIALAWVLRQDGVIAIPKAASVGHVLDNRAAADIRLSAAELDELDRAFPPPQSRQPLEMI